MSRRSESSNPLSFLVKDDASPNISSIRDILKGFLEDKREEIKQLHRLGSEGSEVTSLHSEVIDSIIISLFIFFSRIHKDKLLEIPPLTDNPFPDEISRIPSSTEGGFGGIKKKEGNRGFETGGHGGTRENDIAVIALGGYGRGELSPYSDIDIMFLYREKLDPYTEAMLQDILYVLWDLNLDVGHSVRSFKDYIDMAEKDIRVKTSLLEARYLCGKREIYDIFKKDIFDNIFFRSTSSFIREKLKEARRRHIHYGGSPYLLEPHIKEGEGGLRDIQTALWIARAKLRIKSFEEMLDRGLITKREYMSLQRAYDFLQRARNELHYLSGRRTDILSFEFQDEVARLFGYRDSTKFTAPERFMRRYYFHTRMARDISSSLIRRSFKIPRKAPGQIKRIGGPFILSNGEIGIIKSRKEPNPFPQNPALLIEVFYLSQMYGASLSERTRELITESINLINSDFRSSKKINELLISILNSKSRIYETLKTMHETGVLGRYIPEFGRLNVLVLYDLYHKYTVDEHTLLAVRNLEALRNTRYKKLEKLSDLLNSIKKPWVLFLALFLHDIGKASGKEHIKASGGRINSLLDRLGLKEEEGMRVTLLARNHLLMSLISQRRELSDPGVIESFASEVVDEENLKMLYLLSYADISAVRPGFWTDWKATLLEELYLRTLYALRGEPLAEDETEKLSQIEDSLKAYSDISREKLMAHIENFDKRYLLITPADTVVIHIRMAEKIVKEKPVITYSSDITKGITEFTILSYDEPGIFSKIAGALASRNINIVSGQIFTGKDGLIIDRIQVSNPGEDPYALEETLRRVTEDIRNVLSGQRTVEELIPVMPSYLKEIKVPRIPVKVIIDNKASGDYTLIEVFCRDRVGLLYQVTRALYENGIDISSAKINTEAGRVADVFYVRGIDKKKILDDEKTREIKDALRSVISE